MTNPEHRQYTIGGHAFEAPSLVAGLYLVATPIGNLGDVTLRALETLAASDTVLCEDTRMTVRLLDRYGIRASLQSYHDHNGAQRRPAILKRLKDGCAISLVSDAGMPLISDPGFKLVREALAANVPVQALPGPSASLTGLALSGLPSDRFLFCGFLSPRTQQRRRDLEELKPIAATLIFYEGASRAAALVADIAAVLGDRPVAIARELTKLHEDIVRGPAGEVAAALASRGRIRGEVTVIVAPADKAQASDREIEHALEQALADLPASKAAARVARELGVARQDVYALALAMKERGP